MHLRGFHSVWMIDPGAKAETGYSVYDSGTANDVWVKTADGKEYNGDAWPGKVAWPKVICIEVEMEFLPELICNIIMFTGS